MRSVLFLQILIHIFIILHLSSSIILSCPGTTLLDYEEEYNLKTDLNIKVQTIDETIRIYSSIHGENSNLFQDSEIQPKKVKNTEKKDDANSNTNLVIIVPEEILKFQAKKDFKTKLFLNKPKKALNTNVEYTINKEKSKIGKIFLSKKKFTSVSHESKNVCDKKFLNMFANFSRTHNEINFMFRKILSKKYIHYDLYDNDEKSLFINIDEALITMQNKRKRKFPVEYRIQCKKRLNRKYILDKALKSIKYLHANPIHKVQKKQINHFYDFLKPLNVLTEQFVENNEHKINISHLIRIFAGFEWIKLNQFKCKNLYDLKNLHFYFISPLRYLKSSYKCNSKLFFVKFEKILEYSAIILMLGSNIHNIQEYIDAKIKNLNIDEKDIKLTLVEIKRIKKAFAKHIELDQNKPNFFTNKFNYVFNKLQCLILSKIQLNRENYVNYNQNRKNLNLNISKTFLLCLLFYYVDRYANKDARDSTNIKNIILKNFKQYIYTRTNVCVAKLIFYKQQSHFKNIQKNFKIDSFKKDLSLIMEHKNKIAKIIEYAQHIRKCLLYYNYCIDSLLELMQLDG